MLDEKSEEILEAVWVSRENKNNCLAAIQQRCDASFTNEDIDRLISRSLITRDADRLDLTPEGSELARHLIRRHRLAEVLLTSILMLKHADMEEIACKIEHSLLPEVEESICTLLGHPEVCPDGKPIPKGRCCRSGLKVLDATVVSLAELQPGESGKITYIKPLTHSNLHQLISFGLHPGVIVTVHRKKPAFCIKFENTELALDEKIVTNIFVWRISPETLAAAHLL
jgi:DtxR family Mn-dependent transcriptional regulator